jgi:hypothetical protein
MDNKLAPIEAFVKEGLVQQFRRVFATELTFSNVSGKRHLAQKRSQGKILKYPLAFAELQSVSLATDRQRATPLQRRGLIGMATTDNVGTYQLPLIPMDSTYQILYISNDFSQLEKFAKLWLQAAACGFLTFSVTYGVATLGVNFNVEPTINFPQRDSNPDAIEEYELTSTLTIRGWASNDKLVSKQAANSIEVDARLAAERALYQEDSKGAVQVFKITKKWPESGPF